MRTLNLSHAETNNETGDELVVPMSQLSSEMLWLYRSGSCKTNSRELPANSGRTAWHSRRHCQADMEEPHQAGCVGRLVDESVKLCVLVGEKRRLSV